MQHADSRMLPDCLQDHAIRGKELFVYLQKDRSLLETWQVEVETGYYRRSTRVDSGHASPEACAEIGQHHRRN